MGGGGSTPSPDPNIGLAALKSAEVGENMLSWMKDQSEITNKWAAEDRDWYNTYSRPMQNEYIEEAKTWGSPARKAMRANEARADVEQQVKAAEGTRLRQSLAMGIKPGSGAWSAGARRSAVDAGLAKAGAMNLSNRAVDAEADARKVNAINMGSGLAVNPATSMGLSNGAIQAGGSGAMAGYGQQGQLLNTQYQQQLQQHQADQQAQGGLFGALGSIVGMMPMLSSKDAKTNKKPIKEGASLGAVRKMPVESWDYKPGMGDGGSHVGTYAEDFKAATGQGDGKTIDVASAIGVTMGAIKDLDAKVDRLAGKRRAA